MEQLGCDMAQRRYEILADDGAEHIVIATDDREIADRTLVRFGERGLTNVRLVDRANGVVGETAGDDLVWHSA